MVSLCGRLQRRGPRGGPTTRLTDRGHYSWLPGPPPRQQHSQTPPGSGARKGLPRRGQPAKPTPASSPNAKDHAKILPEWGWCNYGGKRGQAERIDPGHPRQPSRLPVVDEAPSSNRPPNPPWPARPNAGLGCCRRAASTEVCGAWAPPTCTPLRLKVVQSATSLARRTRA